MSGLDLDELVRLAEGGFLLKPGEVERLAAEVRALRAERRKILGKHYLCRECYGTHESCQAARVKCCPDCYHEAPVEESS